LFWTRFERKIPGIPESVRNNRLRPWSEKVPSWTDPMISLKKRNIMDQRERQIVLIRSYSYISNHRSPHACDPVGESDGQILIIRSEEPRSCAGISPDQCENNEIF
jgi:hypothetical protein